jgi:glycerophosphoryl diester phosphodiesterase
MKFFTPPLLACLTGLLVSTACGASARNEAAAVSSAEKELINFRESAQVRAGHPLLIAHRGGVVTKQIPECSLAAIREAAKYGYDAVELDVRQSKDGAPVIFHDNNLMAACGRDTTIGQLTEAEVRSIRYRKNSEQIANLDEALALCRKLHLGVMLDFKDANLNAEFLRRIAVLIQQHGLENSTVTISGHPRVREELRTVVIVPVNAEELKTIERDETISLQGRYWFGVPAWIDWQLIPRLQRAGALVIPALNTFRYEDDANHAKARLDAQRLIAIGVDGFQIDSAYQDFFGRRLPESQ